MKSDSQGSRGCFRAIFSLSFICLSNLVRILPKTDYTSDQVTNQPLCPGSSAPLDTVNDFLPHI